MTTGLGDRWLAGEQIDGVSFGLGDAVVIRAGRAAGDMGRIQLLIGPPPDPRYLVQPGDGSAAVRVRQSDLAQAT